MSEIVIHRTQRWPLWRWYMRQQVGTFGLEVGPEWGEGKAVILFNGWIGIMQEQAGDWKTWSGASFESEAGPRSKICIPGTNFKLVHFYSLFLNLSVCSPSPETVVSPVDPLNNFSQIQLTVLNQTRKRERKGWKVKIHDLSCSGCCSSCSYHSYINGCDWVAKSNPGAWLIVHPDVCRPGCWQPWGKLEAWRERGIRDTICCRFHLLSEGQECGGDLLMSEILISAEKGGEFYIDTDRQPFSWRLLLKDSASRHAGLSAEGYGEVVAIPGDADEIPLSNEVKALL
ncbi:hypothetical protein HAX54_018861 [Datura stramonium]|uniref:Uncharacterized protein n=1 Tax=Datura stramonium TaxID=4076 RepID=A0ABS8RJA5_DATST|nr:hypothetical protein [Datura stramonium]